MNYFYLILLCAFFCIYISRWIYFRDYCKRKRSHSKHE